ncbi:MAG: hypothetical protein NTZ05_17495 [Chloroflexi bacterium]|nr:hypothetical protein [Chloroflexota bacterium]
MHIPRMLLPDPAASLSDALRPALLAAVLTEAAALRIALRFGQALPPDERLGQTFRLVTTVGIVAQNLAVILGAAILLDLGWRQVRQPEAGRRFAGLLLLAAGAATAALTFGGASPALAAGAALLSFGAMAAAVTTAPKDLLDRGRRAWAALAALAYGMLYAHYLAQAAGSFGAAVSGAAAAYFAAEGVAVLAALALIPLLRPRWRAGRALAAAALPALLLYGLWQRAWTVASLSVWTFGFTLFLPGPLYALALGVFLYTLRSLAQGNAAGRRFALGLALLGLAGLKVDYSYFNLLALLAMCMLTGVGQPAGQGAVAAGAALTATGRRAAAGATPAAVAAEAR